MAQVETGTLGQRSPPIAVASAGRTLPKNSSSYSVKNGHLNLNTFSPVNQNGSFAFDQVLKSGKVNRRVKNKGAWKPTWKPTYLVLRPNLLSMYKFDDETGIRASITLSDVTAVASVKKANMANIFGVFSPSKNYHLQGISDVDTADWIERIRQEARVDRHDEIAVQSPGTQSGGRNGASYETTDLSAEEDCERPSSPELSQKTRLGHSGQSLRRSTNLRKPSPIHDYTGNEMTTSYSDFSDVAVGPLPRGQAEIPNQSSVGTVASGPRPNMVRNASQMSCFAMSTDNERVICLGWLNCLRTKGGVKQWKKLWAVLRPKNLSFYKNEQEYSALKIVSMSAVINAAEIDPVSKSKVFCWQLIMEDKTYRFCASSEDSLARWLGSLKSILARRPEESRKAADVIAMRP